MKGGKGQIVFDEVCRSCRFWDNSPVNLRFHMQLIAKEIIFFAKYSLVSVKQHIKNLILSNVQK